MQKTHQNRVSANEPDWTREELRRFWDPGRKLLRTIRCYQYWKSRNNPVARLLSWICIIRHHFWSAVTGADIPINSRIDGGLMIPHPNGIVLHPSVEIGPNCLIFQQVTLGSNGKGLPRIGGHVDIGAGAKILGSVTIGDHAVIGANAVVTRNVKPGDTVVGIPAKSIHHSSHI